MAMAIRPASSDSWFAIANDIGLVYVAGDSRHRLQFAAGR